jgi:hypothetical protein
MSRRVLSAPVIVDRAPRGAAGEGAELPQPAATLRGAR